MSCPSYLCLLDQKQFWFIDTASKTTVTQSKPSDFPSLLRQKLSTTQSVERHKIQTEAYTNETCDQCGRTEVRFSAVQLRSADEGSTIFYTCECGHKYDFPLYLLVLPVGKSMRHPSRLLRVRVRGKTPRPNQLMSHRLSTMVHYSGRACIIFGCNGTSLH